MPTSGSRPSKGDPVTVRIPAGTQSGRTFRVKGRGISSKRGDGDLLVEVELAVPQKLNRKQRKALQDYVDAGGGESPRRGCRIVARDFHGRDRAVYVISVAAELAGVHPQTLRIYERKGLVDPARTGGGSRRYSDADIERLQRIHQLTSSGLNLAGVERVLALEAEVERLAREVRRLQGEVARRAGALVHVRQEIDVYRGTSSSS